MNDPDVRTVLRAHLVDDVLVGDESRLNDQTNLIEEEILDSLGIFSLVEFLEGRFGIEVAAEEVAFDNFQTLDSITHLVTAKLPRG